MFYTGLSTFPSSFSFDQIPDLTGKTAIVTGGNSGIGYETVRQLVAKGARTFVACRSKERAEEAIERIKSVTGKDSVEFLRLDLQDLKQVRSAADEFLGKGVPLDILINNAGIMAVPFALTKDGIESQMGTNHLGHFALTLALLPALEKAAPSRVVTVSSYFHILAPRGGLDLEHLQDEAVYAAWPVYGQSKLANILFTRGFNKRYGDRGIYANCLHPGSVRTGLSKGLLELYGLQAGWRARFLAPFYHAFEWAFYITPEQGALTQLYLATAPEVVQNGHRGHYFVAFAHLYDQGMSQYAQDDELVEKLWEWSEKVVKEKMGAVMGGAE